MRLTRIFTLLARSNHPDFCDLLLREQKKPGTQCEAVDTLDWVVSALLTDTKQDVCTG